LRLFNFEDSSTKIFSITIPLILLLFTAAIIAAVPFVSAADVETRAFLAVNPNPVGVNQLVDVTAWLEPIPITATDKFHNMQVTITKPDGTTETRGPLTSSPIGSQYFEFTPSMIGIYKFQMSYAGETFTFGGGTTFLPSTSPVTELVVQQNPISGWQESPPPNDYWTRPINSLNRNWYTISGNWLMRSYSAAFGSWDSAMGYNPYSQAARSAHVMWTKELCLGGVTGGDFGTTSYYSGLSYEPKFNPPVIMNGRLYYNLFWASFGVPYKTGFVCVDLRTGEELFRNNQGYISNGQLYNFVSANQMGTIPYLWNVGFGVYQTYDAFTGDLVFTFAGSMPGTVQYGADGTMFVYIMNNTAGWLARWNSTKAFQANGFMQGQASGLLQFRPVTGGTFSWAKGLDYNVTIPIRSITTGSGGTSFLSINGIVDDKILIAMGGGTSENRLHAAYDVNTGQELWHFDRASGNRAFGPWVTRGAGIYAQYDPFNMLWVAYDAYTGNLKWLSDPAIYPWGTYIGSSGGIIAAGKLLSMTYDGYLHAYDITNGKELWKFFSGNAGRETPYGTYPMYYGPIVADGVVYVSTGEHSPTQPSIRGEKLFAVDLNTGQGLWTLNAQMPLQAIADGYLVGYNAYDNHIYCFGKGPSATEVSVSQNPITEGSATVIQGKIIDQSPAQPDTPAIADTDMAAYMEYKHEQQPYPASLHGVPVNLQATSPDGTTTNIATVNSNGYGIFAYEWTPPSKGMWTITATFQGTDSYGSSQAATLLSVSTDSSTASVAGTDSTLIIAVAAIALIVAIVAIIAVILALRKR
jgi:hypothetical protein